MSFMPAMSSLCMLLCAAAALPAADLILHNARVLTVDGKFTVAEAIAITGNRLTAVGRNADVLKLKTPQARVVDAKGRTVMPGLIDSHVHALSAALSEYRAKLPPLDSFSAVQAYIRERMKSTPKGEWIVVPRTFPTRLKEMRMPTREVLDVTTEHPVGFDASYVWVVNSFALKAAGITRDTANPPGGEIGHDAKGEPNGILRNANSLLKGLKRNTESAGFSKAEKMAALKEQLERYAEAGLTAVSDRAVTSEDIELYEEIYRARQLPVRAVMTWRLDASPDAAQVVERMRAAPYRHGRMTKGIDPQWLRFGAFKVTLDGGMTIGTAFQRAPYGEFGRQLYGQTNPDARGQLFLSPEKLYAIMEAARDLGWQMTAHSQGGGAIDALLDCFERLNRQKRIAPTRSHLMHASFQSPEALSRLQKLGLPADVQPAWLYLDGPALSKVFPGNGMKYFIPLKSYRDRGILVAGGSDHMIGHDKNTATNPYNPFYGMWTAVTRRMTNGAVLHPEEALSREEALRMYTSSGAWMQHGEKERGSLEAGKLADLVMLDRDFMTVPPDEIKNLRPVMVVIDGKIVRE
ncbi:MAG TPA: amidohydrolase [Bryobacteraceae bacterium]|nr:amidohydrolase [Bryobacteraceae bacterium]